MINSTRAGLTILALASAALAGCSSPTVQTELPAYRPHLGAFCHWGPGKDRGDVQVCPGGLQTAPYTTGSPETAVVVAHYGPIVAAPGETGAALCRRVRLEYRDTGADVSDFTCMLDRVLYQDPELSPKTAGVG